MCCKDIFLAFLIKNVFKSEMCCKVFEMCCEDFFVCLKVAPKLNTQEKLHNTQHTILNTHTFLTHKWTFFIKNFFMAFTIFAITFEGKTLFQIRFYY
jgi:hypothetical protein